MKNFKKKFLAFSVLSVSGVLLMAGVTGCNSKPKAEVAYGGTATFSSEYFDCYMTQKQGEIEEELVTTSRMTLLESGATGVKIHSSAAPKNSKISWVVEDATGAETNEVNIDENGNVTLPTVTSGRKDYKVWCVAKEVVEEGEGHQVKTAIDLTVVPTGSIEQPHKLSNNSKTNDIAIFFISFSRPSPFLSFLFLIDQVLFWGANKKCDYTALQDSMFHRLYH